MRAPNRSSRLCFRVLSAWLDDPRGKHRDAEGHVRARFLGRRRIGHWDQAMHNIYYILLHENQVYQKSA